MAGSVRVSRSGPTNVALTVQCKFAGTAALGRDYGLVSTNTVTIPAGSPFIDVEVQTKTDTILESPEFATLILTPGANYKVGAPSSASVYIVD